MKKLAPALICGAAMLLVCACASLKNARNVPAAHPEKVGPTPPVCSECHDSKPESPAFWRFDHNASFARGGHKAEAQQNERMCSMCHEQKFCGDCHGLSTGLKPSDRRPGDAYRNSIHRGDYKSRHQIDGRLDPASCFGCHGNPKASAACGHCHGR